MARDVQFKTTVAPVTYLLIEQLSGALQILAALVLSDEEGEAMVVPGSGCKPNAAWIKNMREELLSPEWRPTLVAMLKHQNFLTNTHPGYPLGPLTEAPASPLGLNHAYLHLEKLLQGYANGEGDDAPDDFKAYWVAKLVEAGHKPEIAEWTLRSEGAVVACQAAMERIMRPIRTIPRVPENCPGISMSEGNYSFSVSWGPEIPLSEAHLHDDVYPIVGSLCAWWADRSGDTILAAEWRAWMETCMRKVDNVR